MNNQENQPRRRPRRHRHPPAFPRDFTQQPMNSRDRRLERRKEERTVLQEQQPSQTLPDHADQQASPPSKFVSSSFPWLSKKTDPSSFPLPENVDSGSAPRLSHTANQPILAVAHQDFFSRPTGQPTEPAAFVLPSLPSLSKKTDPSSFRSPTTVTKEKGPVPRAQKFREVTMTDAKTLLVRLRNPLMSQPRDKELGDSLAGFIDHSDGSLPVGKYEDAEGVDGVKEEIGRLLWRNLPVSVDWGKHVLF